ncbi:TetR/AcrR family transcriptional regulator [Pullulanibacillus sp. KACC 23026]|uniref:TetR/AcrR family transcriptional regulator n=1 Tax=Pullulanibacillus sp. KACC 23026 TaxID=3028315 RepID=UPI0023AEA4AC|nr:TetR/AcrR family transcriptional regulator [Pullulanibacillus sp. KACC 23026]WEG13344.1 TetR/AcrR family transcriptional regulator [Pullulanibacillus sp. KACC 23026]
MSNLREKRKLENQKKIIRAARHLFSGKGFQQTTISEIASEAQVGVGTIYNYYASKGVLLFAVFSEDMEHMRERSEQSVDLNSGNVVELLLEIMKGAMVFFEMYPKRFWREILHVMTEETEEMITLRQGLFGFDQEVISWVETIIKEHSFCFRIPVDSKMASQSLYGSMIMLALFFIYDDDMTYEQLLSQIEHHIQFIFLGKLNES